jgi:hypothetical protein
MVYYHIPEDCDSQEQPNGFGIGKVLDDIRVADIRRLFPVEGTYHFRFKQVSGKNTIWMDLNDEDAKVIPFQGRVVMKVTRLSWEKEIRNDSSQHSNAGKRNNAEEIDSKPASMNLLNF